MTLKRTNKIELSDTESIELGFVRDQEVDGSNPFAPTTFPLSIHNFTPHFLFQQPLRFYGQYGQHRWFWEFQIPSPLFLLALNGMPYRLSTYCSRHPQSRFHVPSRTAPNQQAHDSF